MITMIVIVVVVIVIIIIISIIIIININYFVMRNQCNSKTTTIITKRTTESPLEQLPTKLSCRITELKR